MFHWVWRAGGVSPPSQHVCRTIAQEEEVGVRDADGAYCTVGDSGDLRPLLAKIRLHLAKRLIVAMFAIWMVVKVVYIEVAIPVRDAHRQTRAKAALLASLVPEDSPLFLMKIKDEGIMFYYGRPVLRVASPHALPSTPGPLFCILTEEEWHDWSGRSATIVERLQDAQGDGMVLVRLE